MRARVSMCVFVVPCGPAAQGRTGGCCHYDALSLTHTHTHTHATPPTQGDWLKFGFLLSVYYLTVWLGIGGAWWKVIGLW